MKYFRLSIIALFLVVTNSCELESECYFQIEVPVVRFEMPDSIPVDSILSIQVVYVTYSNCSQLNTLRDYLIGDTLNVRVIADYEGCECPTEAPDSIATFDFSSKVPRTYIFRAFAASSGILQDTLKVY